METYDYEVAESGCLLFLLNHYVRSMITRRPSVAVLSKTTSTSSRVCSTTTSGVCSTTTSTTSWVCSTTTYTSVWSSFKTFPTTTKLRSTRRLSIAVLSRKNSRACYGGLWMEFLSPLSHTDTKMVPKGFVFSLPPSLSRWTSWPWVLWSVLFTWNKWSVQWTTVSILHP